MVYSMSVPVLSKAPLKFHPVVLKEINLIDASSYNHSRSLSLSYIIPFVVAKVLYTNLFQWLFSTREIVSGK